MEASLWRGRGWWGLQRGDRQVIFWGRPLDGRRVEFTIGLKYRFRNCVQFDVLKQFDRRQVDKIVSRLRSWRPPLVYGFGSSLAGLANDMASRGIALDGPERPKLVQYTADRMTRKERELASQVLSAPVVSQYGACECGGIAQECPAGKMHISVDHVLLEFLRPDGTATAPGEVGEIVITTLNNLAMPLIRYRIGDLGIAVSEMCACGLPWPLMHLESGKAVDLISTSTHTNISAYVLDYANYYLQERGIHGVKQFFVEQVAPDRFTLIIIREEPFDQRAIPTFIAKMKEAFGEQIEIETRFANSIPLSSAGKRRYFERRFQG